MINNNSGIIHNQKLLIGMKQFGFLYKRLDSTSTSASVSLYYLQSSMPKMDLQGCSVRVNH